MRADTPDVEVRLFETDDLDELVGNVLTDETDLAFTVDIPDDPRLTIEVLAHDPFVVLAPLGAVPGPTVRADDLRSKPLIGQPGVETVQRMVDERLQQAGIVADYAFRFRNNAAVQTMVRTGMGWAVMPSLAVDHDDPDIGIHPFEPPLPPRAIQLIRKHGRTLPPGSRSVPSDRRRGRTRTPRTMSGPTTTNEVMQIPAVRLLLASTAAAAVGQNVLLTVLFKQVFDLTGNPLDIAFIGLAQFVPALLLVLVSGWVADRFDRRRVAGLFLGGRGLCALALIVFSIRGSETVWHLFVIAFVLGTADAMLAPARRSIAPFVAPQRLFPSVIALWTATFTASAIIGPILGGFIYSVGASWAYGIAAVLQFAAIVPMVIIHYHRTPERITNRPTLGECGRRAALRASHAGRARDDLARSVRRVVRWSDRADPCRRGGTTRCRRHRVRVAPRRAGHRRRGDGPVARPPAVDPARRPDAAGRRRASSVPDTSCSA